VDTTTQQVLSVAESARVLGLSRNSIYRLAQAGKIRTAHTGVRRVLLPRAEIERVLRGEGAATDAAHEPSRDAVRGPAAA